LTSYSLVFFSLSQISGGNRQKAKGKGQRAKGKRQKAKGKGQKAKGKGQRAKGKGQRAALFFPHPTPYTPTSHFGLGTSLIIG